MAHSAEATRRQETAERLTLAEFTRRHLRREKTDGKGSSVGDDNAYAAHVALVMAKLKV
jgi:hypothetical protein